MVLGDANRTAGYGESARSLMAEARAQEPGTGAASTRITEALLLPRLLGLAHDGGGGGVVGGERVPAAHLPVPAPAHMPGSAASDLLGPTGLEPSLVMASSNRTRCAEQILSYGGAEKVLIGAALTALTLSTICGNVLVLVSVCFVKKLRQPSNYLIVSLALADLSVALAVMPFVSITDLIGGRWIFGQFFCNVFIAMDVMCCTASIMTLCVISIDR